MADALEEKGSVTGPLTPAPPAKESSALPSTSKFHPYPPAVAEYAEVIANPKLFMESLEKLHSTLGTKFMIPTVGGKELNLHRLFVEVTARGGIEKVIRDRRWKEITAVFNFPSTATNASFVLRKYYNSLLHHYEQIYFFKSEGWNQQPGGGILAPPSINQPQAERSAEPVASPMEAQATGMKRKATSEVPLGASLPPSKNCHVEGVIDGKFEHGYLVTVLLGGQKLQGVLYHIYDNSAAQVPLNNSSMVSGTRRRRRRKKLSKLDPTHPKPNRSGYNFFFAEQHARLKPLHPGKDREISKMIGDLWNKLTEAEKAVYQEIGLKDKERYRSEMVVYRERQKTGQTMSAAMPIQQRPAEPNTETLDADLKPKMEEGDTPPSVQSEGGSSTESDSDLDASPEPQTGADSVSIVEEPLTESDDFELRMRDQARAENDHGVADKGKDPEVTKEDPSINASDH